MPTEIKPLLDRLREIEQEHRGYVDQIISPQSVREKMMKRVGTITEAINAVEILALIDQLRDESPSWITINQDNEEPPPNCAIEVGGEWTNYEARRVEGESILGCLKQAIELRCSHLASRIPPI